MLIVGSTNWSVPALITNNESSVCIESFTLAHYYTRYFQRLVKEKYTPTKKK
ncbi:hypothetical protein ACFL27_22395 [candidate division CSSED10-310 bacterium]|uniref:Phospholipase D-like domain-containing protein n=1 Tax=candidate division CSSED10-310 bacterium TaxID=2855610 RepID=A0ABV6Z3P4_UNCC1